MEKSIVQSPWRTPALVLGIETSCDDTGIAVFDSERGLLAHALYSQIAIHAPFGGIVPELASRDHIRKTVPLIRQVCASAGVTLRDLTAVAYTAGPGLMGALLVGAGVARGLAWSLGIPVIGVHHMEGHLLAPMLECEHPSLPFLALLVSGGHSQLVQVDAIGCYRVLGDSRDDAAGEAFDKAAMMLGLGYPGGPAIERLATGGDPARFRFPRPMTDRPGLEFSFSGLKTYTMNTLREHGDDDRTRADVACAFQEAVVETLALKCRRALHETGLMALVVAGGVSANSMLRERLDAMAGQARARVYYPRLEFCTDNGAMIAYAGFQRLGDAEPATRNITIRPRWPLAELRPPRHTVPSAAE